MSRGLGDVYKRQANGLYRQVPRTSDVNVGGLNVAWNNGDDWTIAVDFGYADQNTERTLERLRTRLDTGYGDDTTLPRLANGMVTTYDISSGYPIATVWDCVPACGQGTVIDPLDTTHQYVEQLRRTTTWEEADDTSFRLDFTHDLEDRSDGDIYSFFDEFRFGFAWNEMNWKRRQTQKQGDVSQYDINSVGVVVSDHIMSHVGVPGFIHQFAVADINDPVFSDFLTDPTGYETQQSSEFDVGEEVNAFYLQGNFSGEGRVPYRGNIGIRYVRTEQSNLGWVGEGSGDGFEPADPDNPQVLNVRKYDHVLPSFNLAFDLTDEWVLRFAANKALTRPDPIDLRVGIDIDNLNNPDDDDTTGGNPNLEPYTTVNLDASIEWYPERGGSYGLGLFHKNLESFIASGGSSELVQLGTGEEVEYFVRRPVNTDGGTINGVEFQFHVPFDSFTSGFMSYFGINGSYTYVDAEMDAVVPDRGTPISLRGTSEKSGNFVVYFERERFGARVAANYRSDYLFQEASDTDRFDEFTNGRTIVDMNLDYIIMENIKVRFSANNLTEERRSRYWDTPSQWYSDERDNGREYVLEFRYTSD